MAFRTQKISQMTPKGADLEATDLIEVSTIESGSYVTRSITGQELIDAIPLPPTGLTVGTTPISSGTIGRVLFQGTGNVLQQSSSLFWDSTNNRLGIGTSSPSNAFDIVGAATGGNPTRLGITNSGASGLADLFLFNDTGRYLGVQNFGSTATGTFAGINNANLSKLVTNNSFVIGTQNTNPLVFAVGASVSTGEVARFSTNSNFLINTTTDAGFRLDVNGTARVQNTLTVTKGASNFFTFDAGANGSDLAIRFFKSGQIDVSLSSRNQVNIGGQQIFDGLGVNGGFVATRLAVTSGVIAIGNTGGDALCHLASPNGFSTYVQFRENGVSERGLLGFQNGTSYLQIRTNGATNMSNGTFSTAFFSTGNVGINTTTDAGFRLDVNGTARVQGPSGYSMTYDANGIFNLYGTYSRLDLFNSAGSLRARLNNDGPNGTLTLYQNATSYIFLNGAQSGNNSYIATALSIGNQSAANASSILELTSTTRGFLPPRMTTTQKNAIASPAAGLMVYDTTLNVISYYNGSMWI